MSDFAEITKVLRPAGFTSPYCYACVYFGECGGLDTGCLFGCFEQCRIYGPESCDTCDNVCPRRPDFFERMCEVNGFRCDDIPAMNQTPLRLPIYVPMIHHKYSRNERLACPVVGIELYDLFRGRDRYTAIATSPQQLREQFSLQPETRVLLRGTAKDKQLERYWAFHGRDDAAGQLARLGIDLVVGPNFSHFLDVPRTDNLFNRKRQLLCLSKLSEAGVSVVPHLSAVMPADWRFWGEFLRRNPNISLVAVEFQTGNRTGVEGRKVVDMLARLQHDLGRHLTPLLIGGFQYVAYAAKHFRDLTLMDSRPFMTATKRNILDMTAREPRWVSDRTLPGFGIGYHLLENIRKYSALVQRRAAQGRAAAKMVG